MLALSLQIRRLTMLRGRPTDHLKGGERAVLHCIECSKGQEMKASEIAGFLGVTAPSITFVLNRMEGKGYIQRTMDKKDRRAVIVTITAEGKELLNETIAEMRLKMEELAAHLGEEDSRTLVRIAGRLLIFYSEKKGGDDAPDKQEPRQPTK